MFYDQVKVKEINSEEEYTQAHEVLSNEFPAHEGIDLLEQYEWTLIAKKSNKVIGVITANKYIPKKALLCYIVVEEKYSSRGIDIRLMKEMAVHLKERGYTHMLGDKPRLEHELDISIPDLEQMEGVLRVREERNKKNKE